MAKTRSTREVRTLRILAMVALPGSLVLVHPGGGEAAGQPAVAREEVAEHPRGGQEVADKDRPARQLVQHPLGQNDDRPEEEYLERGEEDDEREDEQRLALRARDQQGADDPEGNERQAVDDGVAEHRWRRRGLAEQRGTEEPRRPERLALDRVDREEPERDDGRADEPRDDALAQDAAPRADERAGQRAMGAEEVPEHRHRGEQVADEDRPPHEGAEHGLAQGADDAEEEHLEAGEENYEADEEGRLALAHRHEARRDDAERDECQAVDDRVAEHVPYGEPEPARVGDALEDRRAEEPRCQQGAAARQVEQEEPHRDDGRPDQAGDDALTQDRALDGRHDGRRPLYQGSRASLRP